MEVKDVKFVRQSGLIEILFVFNDRAVAGLTGVSAEVVDLVPGVLLSSC